MIRLRQSTASQEVALGPFVDGTDGFTLKEALGPIAASDLRLWKNGATATVNASTTASLMSGGDGMYLLVLGTGDTDTVGPMFIIATPAGARPIRIECEVLPGTVFDFMFSTTGTHPLARMIAGAETIGTGIVLSATTTQITPLVLDPAHSATVADQFKGKVAIFTAAASSSGNIKLQQSKITASSTSGVLTLDPPLQSAPVGGDIFVIVDANQPTITTAGHVMASIEALQRNTTAALRLTLQALAAASGTLTTGSTTTVLNISTISPSLSDANQLRGRVVLIVDDAASEAALKIQGGRISASTTTTITLEQPLTRTPASGNVFVIV